MDGTLNSLQVNIDGNFQKNQERFTKDLNTKVEESNSRLNQLEARVSHQKYETEDGQEEEGVIEELRALESELRQEGKALHKYRYQKRVISSEEDSDQQQVDSLLAQLHMRLSLWLASQEWSATQSLLQHTILAELDLPHVNAQLVKQQKLVGKVQ